MNANQAQKILPGAILIYNDGRQGHTSAKCEVLTVSNISLLVQFEDRADTTTIKFTDAAWINFLSPLPALNTEKIG
jgi:hypothetical protein